MMYNIHTYKSNDDFPIGNNQSSASVESRAPYKKLEQNDNRSMIVGVGVQLVSLLKNVHHSPIC